MFTVLSNTRNASLYIIAALAIMVVIILAFTIGQSIAVRGPAIVPVTGSQDVNSATQSYIAWAEAADSERTVVDSATRSYTSWARALDAVDSATRSYIAWGQALEAARNANALDSATRSYIAWGEALEAALLTYRSGEKDLK